MSKMFRDPLRAIGAPEDPVATDTSSAWSAMSLLKAVYGGIAPLAAAASAAVADLAAHIADTADAHASSAIGFLPGGTSAEARTVQAKLREVQVTPQDFHATGLTSDAIQLALNYVSSLGGGTVFCPRGTYVMSSEVTVPARCSLVGDGFGFTIFRRELSHTGNTITLGANTVGANAQAQSVRGIWFLSQDGWSGSYNHLRVNSGQVIDIDDCWFWGEAGQVLIDGGFRVQINGCAFSPVGSTAAAYSIKVQKNSAGTGLIIPTGIFIDNCYLAAGNTYERGIIIECTEVTTVNECYMGGYSLNAIYCNATFILSGLTISNNFVDGIQPASLDWSASYALEFKRGDTYTLKATVTGNNFYGGNGPLHHIYASYSGANWSVAGLTVTGNTFRDAMGAAMRLDGAVGFVIDGNECLNYNYSHTSTIDPVYAAGIYIRGGSNGTSRNGNVSNNVFGGNGATIYAPAADANNYAVWGIYTDGGIAAANINLSGNEGLFRTGGAAAAGDITSQKTLTASTDNMLVRADGTTGRLQSSGLSFSDGLVLTGAAVTETNRLRLPVAGGDIIASDASVIATMSAGALTFGVGDLRVATMGSNNASVATKSYVDALAANVGKRQRVRAATTANITIATALNNGDTLDGLTLATGELVLVKDQSAPAENGVYVVGTSPARATEFDTYNEHPGSLIIAEEGSTNADTMWICTSNDGGTLGTTAIAFSRIRIDIAIPVTIAQGGTALTALGTADQALRVNAAGTALEYGALDLTKAASAVAALTSFTPTVTSQTGTITTVGAVAGSWTRVGKRINFKVSATITTNGTGATAVKFDFAVANGPPAADSSNYAWAGREKNVGGSLTAYMLNTTSIYVQTYNSSYPAIDGSIICVSGSYFTA